MSERPEHDDDGPAEPPESELTQQELERMLADAQGKQLARLRGLSWAVLVFFALCVIGTIAAAVWMLVAGA